MQTSNVYMLYDKGVEQWLFPFPADNDRVAIRVRSQYVYSAKGLFGPEDIELYLIGSFNNCDGDLKLFETKTKVEC